ncbi:MAG: flagellar biosynthesis protein FlhB [Dehalococcoidia bacterium]
MAGERTEEATPRRRQDARRRGQVPRSAEVDSALTILASLLVVWLAGGGMWDGMATLMRDAFVHLDTAPVTVDLTAAVGLELVGRALLVLAPLMIAVVALSLLGGMAQTGGPMFAGEAIKPQLKRLNPLSGAKRVFASRQAYVNLGKALLKFGVYGIVAVITFRQHWDSLAALGVGLDLLPSMGVLVDVSFDLALKVAFAMLVIAALDFAFQRYDMARTLRMTQQEVKDEHRQNEGDPQVKGQRERIRRSLLARAMQSVPQADVVIVNPTHFAVALRYDPATSHAPVVLAKGTRLMAQRIREIAEEHRIPVVENAPLCRAIYKAARIGQEIPPDLYEATAAILAFVYRLRTGERRPAAA